MASFGFSAHFEAWSRWVKARQDARQWGHGIADRVDRALRGRLVDVMDDPRVPILKEAANELPGDMPPIGSRAGRPNVPALVPLTARSWHS